MNAPRIQMRATCAFTLGAEDIEDGDLLALTPAEATELMARGVVAPNDLQPERETVIELKGRAGRWQYRVRDVGGQERAWGSYYASPALAVEAAVNAQTRAPAKLATRSKP